MNFLIDTHFLLWSLIEPDRIDVASRGILENPDHVKYASVVSFWEISLKYALGKLSLAGSTPEGVLSAATEAGYIILALDPEHVASSHQLRPHGDHRDPFDRLLIWQCLRNDFVMLTADRDIRNYEQEGLRLCER